MLFAHADAAPADGVQIAPVDQLAQSQSAVRLVAVDVIQRRSGIEAGVQPEADAFR